MSSKTLSIKKPPADAVKTYTEEDLERLVAERMSALQAAKDAVRGDPTVDLPTGDIPSHLIADKSALPPPDQRGSAPVQPPPKLWGHHIAPSPIQGLIPDPRLPVDPRTGFPANQVFTLAGSSISPPPSRNFR